MTIREGQLFTVSEICVRISTNVVCWRVSPSQRWASVWGAIWWSLLLLMYWYDSISFKFFDLEMVMRSLSTIHSNDNRPWTTVNLVIVHVLDNQFILQQTLTPSGLICLMVDSGQFLCVFIEQGSEGQYYMTILTCFKGQNCLECIAQFSKKFGKFIELSSV